MGKIVAFSATKETPFLLVSLDRVRQKFQAFRTHFPQREDLLRGQGEPGKEVLALLRDLGSCFDIASVYELDQMLDLGVTPDRLSFGNTIKKARHVREAYDKGHPAFRQRQRGGYPPPRQRKRLVRGYSFGC